MEKQMKHNLTISSSKRIVGFDIVRILACAFVCIVHFNASVCGWSNGVFLNPNSIVPNFLLGNRVYLGTLGVSLFFIISGASLMLSNKPSGNTMGFYKKRILNIYPQFWIAFAVATLYDFFSVERNELRKRTKSDNLFRRDGWLSERAITDSLGIL